jgi:hypothetical protein
MFKFLFGGRSTPEVTIETDRARFERLVSELNAVIDGLAVKPRVTIDPETGHILPETPEQFADEELALPAPDAAPAVAAAAETPEPVAEPAAEAADGDAPEAPRA